MNGCEIIVVDDDSPDGTWQIVRDISINSPLVRLVHRVNERGLTSAITRGVTEARGDTVIWMDCDFSMPPDILPLLVQQVENGADIAIGSRYTNGGKDAREDWMPIAFSWLINRIAQLLIRAPVRDYTTGFVAARKRVLNQIELRGDYGEYCIDFLTRAARKGFSVAEVGYVCKPRKSGDSKTAGSFVGFIRRGWNYVVTILRLTIRYS